MASPQTPMPHHHMIYVELDNQISFDKINVQSLLRSLIHNEQFIEIHWLHLCMFL